MRSANEAIPFIEYQNLFKNSYTINQELSIYISHIQDEYATEKYIKVLFKNLNIADVKHVQFKKNDDGSFDASIYMNKWFHSMMVQNLQEKIIDYEMDAKLVYDDPNYWLLHYNGYISHNIEDDLTTLQTSVKEQSKQITSLENKNIALENTLKNVLEKINWNIKLHDANIEYICNKINSNTSQKTENTMNSSDVQHLYKNNSCCGDASNAWIPSYPQISNIWNEPICPRATYM